MTSTRTRDNTDLKSGMALASRFGVQLSLVHTWNRSDAVRRQETQGNNDTDRLPRSGNRGTTCAKAVN